MIKNPISITLLKTAIMAVVLGSIISGSVGLISGGLIAFGISKSKKVENNIPIEILETIVVADNERVLYYYDSSIGNLFGNNLQFVITNKKFVVLQNLNMKYCVWLNEISKIIFIEKTMFQNDIIQILLKDNYKVDIPSDCCSSVNGKIVKIIQKAIQQHSNEKLK